MKQYVIDQLRPNDHEKIRSFLEKNFGPARVKGIYWIPLEESLLTRVQAEHSSCGPFYFAVELESHRMSCEFLIRPLTRVHCSCIGYADRPQQSWIIRFADELLDRLGILV